MQSVYVYATPPGPVGLAIDPHGTVVGSVSPKGRVGVQETSRRIRHYRQHADQTNVPVIGRVEKQDLFFHLCLEPSPSANFG